MAADAFSVTGGDGLVVERLDPHELTVTFVVDNGPAVPRATLAVHQGAAIELIRNLPEGVGVAVGLVTASGDVVAPTGDRAQGDGGDLAARHGRWAVGAATLGAALRRRHRHPRSHGRQPRRQLIVLTRGRYGRDRGRGRRHRRVARPGTHAALRVVAGGDAVGVNLNRAANGSGGVAVPIDGDSAAMVRTVDVLTTTLADQYRLTATMRAPGSLVVRLAVDGRSYATTVPVVVPRDVVLAPTSVAATTTAPPTTTTPPTTTPPTTLPAPAAAAATTARSTTTAGSSGERAASPAAGGVEAVFGVAAVAMVVVAVRRRRGQRRHR